MKQTTKYYTKNVQCFSPGLGILQTKFLSSHMGFQCYCVLYGFSCYVLNKSDKVCFEVSNNMCYITMVCKFCVTLHIFTSACKCSGDACCNTSSLQCSRSLTDLSALVHIAGICTFSQCRSVNWWAGFNLLPTLAFSSKAIKTVINNLQVDIYVIFLVLLLVYNMP
jgi:hypothetical protein